MSENYPHHSSPEADLSQPTEVRDTIGQYIEAMRKIPLLEPQEEVSLAKTMELGASAEAILLGREQRREEADGTLYYTTEERLAQAAASTTVHNVKRMRQEAVRNDEAYTAYLMDRFPEDRVSDDLLQAWMDEGSSARTQFITANTALAFHWAKRDRNSSAPLLEKVQWANLGLIRAVDKFDYRRGLKFSTHAAWWIKESLQREAYNTHRPVRLPVDMELKLNSLSISSKVLEQELGREPTLQEITEQMNRYQKKPVAVQEVAELLRNRQVPLSYSQIIGEDNYTLGDIIVDAQDAMEDVYARADQARAVETVIATEVKERFMQQAYVSWLMGDKARLSAIAEQQGIAIQKLRGQIRVIHRCVRAALNSSKISE